MGFALPNGATVFAGAATAPGVVTTAVSNANGAVFSVATGHNLKVGDIVMVRSGWGLIDSLVAKITAQVDTSVTIGAINTTDVSFFPAGGGKGSLQKISSWTQIPQITEVAQSGGDQQYVQVQFLEDDRQRNLATFKAAKTQTFTFAHDASQPIYGLLQDADRNGVTLAFYMHVPKAKELRYWSAVPAFDPQPTTAVNQVETVQVALAVQSCDMTFYKVAA